ncbi:MAG: UDP-3-O-(3-hydroxymyristoyl)glucosamine N-acyltransferase [Candidatus Aminicenantales bacterium]
MKKKVNYITHPIKLKKLAQLLGCHFEGDGETEILSVSSPEKAGEGDLVFISHRKYIPLLEKSRASAAIIPESEKFERIPVLKAKNPPLTFVRAIEILYEPKPPQPGIHPTAFVSPSAKIGREVSIGALSFIGEEVEIGEKTVIHPLVSIYPGVKIGRETVIHSHVSLREGVQVGNRVIIHNGAVLGADGFGYLQQEDKTRLKIPQLGTLIIEDEVEIGALTAIDRAALGETRIRRGVKIDNLVQVGHNVEIGENSVLAGQVGISGSVKVGKNVAMAGQVGIADHITIGDNVTLVAQSGVMKDIPPNSIMAWTPSMNFRQALKIVSHLPRLPELVKTVKKIEEKLESLEKRNK